MMSATRVQTKKVDVKEKDHLVAEIDVMGSAASFESGSHVAGATKKVDVKE